MDADPHPMTADEFEAWAHHRAATCHTATRTLAIFWPSLPWPSHLRYKLAPAAEFSGMDCPRDAFPDVDAWRAALDDRDGAMTVVRMLLGLDDMHGSLAHGFAIVRPGDGFGRLLVACRSAARADRMTWLSAADAGPRVDSILQSVRRAAAESPRGALGWFADAGVVAPGAREVDPPSRRGKGAG